MVKIWYRKKPNWDYKFQTYYNNHIIVSEKGRLERCGNKKKSSKFILPKSFYGSYLTTNSVPISPPNLNLWDRYLEFFEIPEEKFLRWLKKKKGLQ